MKNRLLVLILLLVCIIPATNLKAQEKTDLKILYVGDDNWLKISWAVFDPQRSEDFMDYLKSYFATVEQVASSEFKEEMSKNYDVTIFDGIIPFKKRAGFGCDFYGNKKCYNNIGLSEDFNYPSLFIGKAVVYNTSNLGTKMDWLCLCLKARAYNVNLDHQIFKGPYKVNPTMNDRDLPKDATHYGYVFDGGVLPQKVSMWRVQTQCYTENSIIPSGLVSRPDGFNDSPECEVISGGESLKTPNAVAISRQGCFFMWGFAASPRYMTDEAKVVLANAVIYTSKLKGEKVIARKYNDRVCTKNEVDYNVNRATKHFYNEKMGKLRNSYKARIEAQNLVKEKNAKGEILTSKEKGLLKQRIDTTKGIISWDKYFNSFTGKYGENFKGSEKKFKKFVAENRKYIGYGGVTFDKDLLEMKLGTDTPELLNKAISMLEKDDNVELASRILDRYTLCTFKTIKEWREWYDTYHDKMFFSESGGWVYLVDTNEGYNPANDYVSKQVSNVVKSMKFETISSDAPVSVNARYGHFDDGREAVIFVFKIMNGYHIYANVADEDGYIPTKLTFSFPSGGKAGEVIYPLDEYYSDSGTTQYVEEAIFVQYIDGDMEHGEIKIDYSYQACDETSCMQPVDGEIVLVKLEARSDY